MVVGEGAAEVDGLEWVKRKAMKMFKGRKGFIYKTRLKEQYCLAWLRDGSRAGGQAGGRLERVAVKGGGPTVLEPGLWAPTGLDCCLPR